MQRPRVQRPSVSSESVRARQRRRRAIANARWRSRLERLEGRSLLSISPSFIPDSILAQLAGTAGAQVSQTAFAPGVSTLAAVAPAANAGVQASWYEFSVARADAVGLVSFTASAPGQSVDLALGLYDADGNLLKVADADSPGPYASAEKLVAMLDSSKSYVIGVFARNDDISSPGGGPLTISVDTADQRLNTQIKVDPTTGKATFNAGSGGDRLQGSADVNYFPLKLTNLGQKATITLQPAAGSGARLYGELFRRPTSRDPWTPIATAASAAAGGGITLAPQPLAGSSLNDAEFLLAVSPQSLAAPVQAYKVSIDGSQSILVPATVSKQGATNLGVCVPTAPGVAGVTTAGNKPLPSTFLLRATNDGLLRVNVAAGFQPVVSVYDDTGTKLLGVASRTTAGPLDLAVEARAGRQYIVRVATLSNVKSGSVTLTVSQSYAATELLATDVAASTKSIPGPLPLDPKAGGSFLRVVPSAGADVLMLRLAAQGTVSVTPQLWILRPGSPQTPAFAVSPAAGQKAIDYAIDLSKDTGPFDLFVTGVGVGVGGTAELSYAVATLPRSIAATDFTTGAIDLQKGTLTTGAAKASVPFGTLWSKLAFSEVGPGVKETLSTVATGPAAVLEYVRQGDVFTLRDWSVRTDGKPTLSGFVPGQKGVGIASMSLALGGETGLGITVASPGPRAGVGVAMVPDLNNPLQSLLQIRNQYLQSPEQRDLWETLLPANVIASKPQEFRFEPLSPLGSLRAKVSILDKTDKVIVAGTSLAGQPLVLTLTPAMVGQVSNAGRLLRFLVEPVAGSDVGDGGYSLKLTAPTTDSRPFELTESKFYPTKPAGWNSLVKLDQNGSPGEGTLPAGLKIQPVNFAGTVTGSITSSTSVYFKNGGDPDAIDVYSFRLPVDPQTKQPSAKAFEIYTTAAANSKVDTTIGLYIAKRKIVADQVTPNVEWYEQVESVSSSRDYYPSDRSTVDAKIVINNPGYLYDQFKKPYQGLLAFDDSAFTLYVVVKGQFGTTGGYTLHVAPTTPTTAGPRPPADPFAIDPGSTAAFLDPLSGAATLTSSYCFATPSTLNIASSISATIRTSNAQVLGGQLFVDVCNDQNVLLYTESVPAVSNTLNVVLDDAAHPFQPSSRYFVRPRAGKPGLNVTGVDVEGQVSPGSPVASATISVATSLAGSGWIEPIPHQNLAPAPDGSARGNLSALGGLTRVQQRLFFFAEATGQATFTIHNPTVTGGTWALYRLSSSYSAEKNEISGTLVDFVQLLNADSLSFSDFLTPGSYALQLYGNAVGPTADAGSYEVQLPAFAATDIPLDPNTCNNATKPLLFAEPTAAGQLDGLITSQYLHVAAPADALKGWTIDLAFRGPYLISSSPVDGLHPSPPDPLPAIQALDEAVATNDTFVIYKRNAFASGGKLESQFTKVDYALDPVPKQEATFDPNDPKRTLFQYWGFKISVNDQPLPGDEYFIGHHGHLNSEHYFVGPHFTVPESGDPDLVVEGIALKPSNGQTFVDIEIRNEGYGSAGDFRGLRTLSNYTPSELTVDFSALGGHASTHLPFEWKPDDPADFIAMLVNQPDTINELRVDNNFAKVLLASVDPHKPTVSIALQDAAMDGEAGDVWGRYLSGVSNVPLDFSVTAADVDKDYYRTKVTGLVEDTYSAVNGSVVGGYVTPFHPDAGTFKPNAAGVPNEIHYQVFDQYGLYTEEKVQRVDVVAKPSFWRDNSAGSDLPPDSGITWNAAKHGYDLALNYNIVNYDKTVEQLLGSVPFIGDKKNTFRINVSGHGFGTLNPEDVPSVPVTLSLLLRVVNQDLYDEQFTGKQDLTDNLSFEVAPVVDSRTLDVTKASISLQLHDYEIANYKSPKIPVYSLGVKGLASFDINLGFGIDVSLDAGIKMGIDDQFNVGLMAPTFLAPTVEPSATLSGDVEVLSLPLAGIEGTVGLKITLATGLKDVAYDEIVPFDQFISKLGLGVSFSLDIKAAATLGGAEVWSTTYNIPLTDPDAGGVITKDVGDANAGNALAKAFALPFAAPGGQPLPLPPGTTGSPVPVVLGGTALVTDAGFQAAPQMVIDPQTAAGLLVQTVQVDADGGGKKGVLQVASRNAAGVWSPTMNLQSADVSNPTLAFTHDAGPKPAAVVVYEALSGYDGPAGRQLADVLARHDLKYRYYDGTSWGGEQPLTPVDNRYDSQASVAFNAAGQGMVAWVHNASATPFAADGSYARGAQDIQAAVWNPVTHAWSAPVAISGNGDGVADIKPATVVDASGNMIVTWIRGTADSNTLFFSRYDGKTWSKPAEVAIDGMTPGSYGEIALGADSQGIVSLLFSHRVKNGDGTIDSRLFSRSTQAAAFGQLAGYDQVSRTFAGYSHLRTTAGADGKLVAYWQQSDGVNDGVFAAALSKSPANARAIWSTPAKLTGTRQATRVPTLAVDLDGKLQTLYAISTPPVASLAKASGSVSAPPVDAPTAAGVGSVSYAPLPELSFSSPLTFPYRTAAAAGTTAIGQATIVNTGMAGDTVTISWFRGLPGGGSVVNGGGTLLGSKTIVLSPGASYDLSVPFTVADGTETYSVQVQGTKGEAISTADDVSSTPLVGKPDIVVQSLVPSIAAMPGSAQTFTATIANTSDMPVDGFDVSFYQGDPEYPQNSVVLLGTTHVDALAANAATNVVFPASLPVTRGNYTFTVVADSGHVIDEAAEANNDGQFSGRFKADPGIAFDAAGKAQVSATLLNASGVSNVEVTVVVRNGGDVAVGGLPVHLTASRDDGPSQPVGDQVIDLLAAGAERTLRFLVSGLDGTQRYRASLDASVEAADDNLSDNTGTTTLIIHGLADLVVTSPTLSTDTPMQAWPLTVAATIGNVGIADAKGVLVEVFARGRDGKGNVYSLKVGGTTIDVAALSHVPVTLPIDTSRLLGEVTLVVRVNRFHSVLESDELNDTASITTTFAPKIIPQVTALAVPTAGTYVLGASLTFTATFNEPVTVVGQPAIAIVAGQGKRPATYVSGSGTNTLVFRSTIQAGDLAPNGISLTGLSIPAGGQISDAVGTPTTLSLPGMDTSGIRIDAVAPTVQSIVAPAAATYGLGQQLTFQLIFTESVTVTGAPTISLKVGSRTVSATYASGSGSAILLFRYIVQSGDVENTGVVLGRSLVLQSIETIRDAAGNAAGLTLPLAKTTGVKVKA